MHICGQNIFVKAEASQEARVLMRRLSEVTKTVLSTRKNRIIKDPTLLRQSQKVMRTTKRKKDYMRNILKSCSNVPAIATI